MKNKFKQFMTAAMAIMMAMSMTTVGFAAGNVTLNPANMKGTGPLAIYGTVEPITDIQVTIPIDGLKFVINADRTITWTDAAVTSQAPAPMDVRMISAGQAADNESGTYNTQTPPNLVADDKYNGEEAWNNLGRAETKANIAISVNNKNISNVSTTPAELGSIKSAYGEDEDGSYKAVSQSLELKGSALYGKAWDNTAQLKFKYDTVLEFEMKA